MRKFYAFLKIFIASSLLIAGVILGLVYGWLVFQYQKISISATNIEIKANNGKLEVDLKLFGNNPLPFALNLKKYEGKVTYGVLSRDFTVDFNSGIFITPGNFQLIHQGANVTPGYPAAAEDIFLSLLHEKKLQVAGEATVYLGNIKKTVPVSLNLTIEKQ